MLIIVESPTKARKIADLLKVRAVATVGHFKDLPESDLGVDLGTYEPIFVYHHKKPNLPADLRKAAKGETVYLAGDPDREGYAISFHMHEEVRTVAKECLRLEIFEVTEKGIREAMAKAVPFEQTNQGLYHAFLGRRIGDRLVGYLLSPLACSALNGRFSVGRVQSPAVRLVVDREEEIRGFVPAPYWIVSIELVKDGTTFLAYHVKGKFEDVVTAQALVDAIAGETHALTESVVRKETKQSPKPPFTTVDLQAAASSKLKLNPEETMRLAQGLFEAGLITYHRTDAVRMDEAFIAELREFLGKALGQEYLPIKPNQFKAKHSQAEAHEGIRPTKMHRLVDIPAVIAKEQLTPAHQKLYELIFRRAVASQMAPAVYDATTLRFTVAGEQFKASGRVLKFEGFLKVYDDSDPAATATDDEKLQTLPILTKGELVEKTRENLEEKKTKPPGRFTMASLVKELEKLGIGRPSTYAAITKNITDRGYVGQQKGKVIPLPAGERLIGYLREKHPWVIDYKLTERMENFLDLVMEQKETWQRFCKGVHQKMGYARPSVRTPRDPQGAPSEKQVKYAESLARKAGVIIPDEALSTVQKLSKWIDGAKQVDLENQQNTK